MNAPIVPLDFGISFDSAFALAMRSPEEIQAVLRRAAYAIADEAKAVWIETAQAANLRVDGGYISGIQAAVIEERSTEGQGSGNFTFDITNHAAHANIVEDGHAAFHLPSRINWSGPKVKMGKKGPYLNIPLRHSAPTNPASGPTPRAIRTEMPPSIYARAVKLKPTIPLNMGPQRSPTGQYLAADRYIRGDHLRFSSMAKYVTGAHGRQHENWRPATTVGHDSSGRPMTNPAWKSSKYSGMIKSQPAPGHTEYMTIRTVTPNSKGWNIPARPGFGIARKVQEKFGGGDGQEMLNTFIRMFVEELTP